MRIWKESECGNYRIESLSKETFPGAIKVIRDSFFIYETVSIGTEVCQDPISWRELEVLCAETALDGVSVVAVQKDTGVVAAALFNKIQIRGNADDKPYFETFAEERCVRPSSKALVQFMLNVDSRCDLFGTYNVDCILELMFLATLMEHGGKNLATLMCDVSANVLAKELKNGPVSTFTPNDLSPDFENIPLPTPVLNRVPQLCSSIFTSYISQKICNKLNFDCVLRVLYDEFIYNGKSYKERIDPKTTETWVVAKRIET